MPGCFACNMLLAMNAAVPDTVPSGLRGVHAFTSPCPTQGISEPVCKAAHVQGPQRRREQIITVQQSCSCSCCSTRRLEDAHERLGVALLHLFDGQVDLQSIKTGHSSEARLPAWSSTPSLAVVIG